MVIQSDVRLGDAMDPSFVTTPDILHGSAVQESCGCAACAASAVAAEAGDGLTAYTGSKPVWSSEQIVGNFLRSNSAWTPGSTITYSFREAKPTGADADIKFAPLTGIERDLTRSAFELISDVVNLNFVEAPDDFRSTGSSNRIYFGKDTAAPDYEWGHAVRWTVSGGARRQITAAEVWISSEAAAQRVWFMGGYNFQALMHEALHTLGIPHPGAYNANGDPITYAVNAEYAQDSRQFSIMSYFAATNTGADHLADFEDPTRTFSGATPLLHDVAALQALYGANMSTRAGDTVYGYNSNAGRAPYDFSVSKTPIFTIWDGGGTDRLDFSQTPFSVNLDLRPGAFSDAFQMTNNISIAVGVVVEDAIGGSANDRLGGNEAGNRLQGAAGDDEILGHGGADLLEGGAGRDNLFGGSGNDRLEGGAQDDRLHGDDGDDLLGGQDGADFIDGGAGQDVLFGDAGGDWLNGGAGADRLHGQDGDDLLGGQDGDDFIDGSQGRDNIFGDAGNDHLIGWIDNDRLHGGDGDDLIGGQDGDDYVEGGQGRDNLFGDSGADHLVGGTEADRLHGQDGDDLMGGQDGDDFIDGGQGRDLMYGDAGNDHLIGWIDDDRLHGGDGDDLMGGQDGNDYLEGGAGRDTLYGDAGDDVIFGGDGADNLTGQAGGDRFVFTALVQSNDGGRDRIHDFNAQAGDVIDLSAIDADLLAAGDQAFSLVGAFSGGLGQAVLTYDAATNTSTLSLDVNGDAVADFRLDISGQVGSSAGFAL